MLDDRLSHGGLTATPMLPGLPPPWKSGWTVKRGRRYYRGDRRTPMGKRIRRQAPTAAELLAIVRGLEARFQRHGELVEKLTTRDLWEMVECMEICAPLGLRPLEACQKISAAHPKGGKARTIDQVAAELIAKKRRGGNRRDKYVDGLERELRNFAGAFAGRQLHTITTGDIEDAIADHPTWAPNTVHGHVSSWKVLFNYARKHEYCFKNPCEAVDLPEREDGEPEIFTLKQVRAMLAHTLFADRDPLLPHCRVYVALGVFAGIRPEEIARLDWEQVDLGNAIITILGAKAKTRQRRMVDMAPNLVAWVQPCARARGPVLRHELAKLRIAIRDAMGLDEWPADVLRHSFGSYHFAHHRSESLVKNQMGHSDDGRMFHSHYRKMVSRQEAAAFWKIFPPAGLLPCGEPGYDDGLAPLRARAT